MMILPDPGVLDHLIRERQRGLRGTSMRRMTSTNSLRLRIGRALIVIGSAVSGERVELPARSPAFPRTA